MKSVLIILVNYKRKKQTQKKRTCGQKYKDKFSSSNVTDWLNFSLICDLAKTN